MPQVITPDNVRSIAGIRILTPSQVSVTQGACIAIYGPGGSGKTTLCGMACKAKYGGKTLVLDAEGGSHVLKHLEPDIEVAPLVSWSDHQAFRKHVNSDPKGFVQEYPNLMLDNLSEIQDLNLRGIVGGDGVPTDIRDWGKSTAQMLDAVRFWRNISIKHGLNVFIVLWDSPEKDKDGNTVARRVNLTSKLATKFPGIVNLVGYLRVQSAQTGLRHLSFRPGESTDAKFRIAPSEQSAKVPLDLYYTLVDNPMDDILRVLRGGESWPEGKYLRPKPGQS
jgi:phage nucleotide-binding protein